MGTLLAQRVLGNFKIQSESDDKVVLTQDVLDKAVPLPFQYGGDIAANMIMSAATRLPALSKLRIMSTSIEYVNPGDYQQIRSYHVEKLRQSDRFVHTLVKLKHDDVVVAVGNVAFHGPEGSAHSLHYDPAFPEDCAMPDELVNDVTLLQQFEADPKMDSKALGYAKRTVMMLHGLGQEAKPCYPEVYFRLNNEPTTRLAFWMRFNEKEIGKVWSDLEHNSSWSAGLLAYASDFRIMGAALRQNPSFRDGKMTTMSHSMWFSPDAEHQLQSPSEWFLYDTRLMMSGNNTVLCEGHMWNTKKQLLCIAKQQGLVRPKL